MCLFFGLAGAESSTEELPVFVPRVRGPSSFRTLPPGKSGPSSLSLQDALKLALEGNPTLLATVSQYRAASLNVDAAYVAVHPTLNLTSTYERQLKPARLPSPYLNTIDNELYLTQVITAFGRVRWNALAARLARKQYAQNVRTAIETMLQDVETAYVTALLASTEVDIARQSVDNRDQYYTLSKNLVAAGEVAEYELLQAESTLLSAQEELLSAENTLANDLAALLVYLGVRPDTTVVLEPLDDPKPPPDDLEQGIARALRQRPEVAALRWSVAAGEAQVKASSLENYPTLYLISQYDEESAGHQLEGLWTVGLELSWTLFDGGAAAIATEQARETVKQTQESLRNAERTVAQDVVKAYQDLVSLWKQIDAGEKSRDRAEETMKVAEIRYKAGLSSGIELLNAQDGYTSALETLASIQAQYRIAWINWRRATSDPIPVDLPAELEVDWEMPPDDAPESRAPAAD